MAVMGPRTLWKKRKATRVAFPTVSRTTWVVGFVLRLGDVDPDAGDLLDLRNHAVAILAHNGIAWGAMQDRQDDRQDLIGPSFGDPLVGFERPHHRFGLFDRGTAAGKRQKKGNNRSFHGILSQ
jgi:hypothetical protein